MMEFKINEKQMTFENEQYVTQMLINGKGEGHDGGEPRLRLCGRNYPSC